MADAPVVHIGENSPEEVAFKLMLNIAVAEGKSVSLLGGNPYVTKAGDRKWLLDTYAECLMAVKDPNGRIRQLHKVGPIKRDEDED